MEPETISLFKLDSWPWKGNFLRIQIPNLVDLQGTMIFTISAAKKLNVMMTSKMLTEPIKLKVLLDS